MKKCQTGLISYVKNKDIDTLKSTMSLISTQQLLDELKRRNVVAKVEINNNQIIGIRFVFDATIVDWEFNKEDGER